MGTVLLTGPLEEPVTVAEAKAHLRVDTDADDGLIGDLITAAREHVEVHCRRVLITQTWDLFLDAWPRGREIVLPHPRLQSVTAVTAHDSEGGAGVFDPANYQVDAISEPGRVRLVRGASWPAAELRPVNGVQVRFVAGYGDAAAVPQTVKRALLLLVGALYENREEIIVAQGFNVAALPFGAWSLLRPHRVWRFQGPAE
jgi:uncharacterized phiE125 gp8 family phage protein